MGRKVGIATLRTNRGIARRRRDALRQCLGLSTRSIPVAIKKPVPTLSPPRCASRDGNLPPKRQYSLRECEPAFVRFLICAKGGRVLRTNRGATRLPQKSQPPPRGWGLAFLEQATGIEPAASAWEAEVLPLDYACQSATVILYPIRQGLSSTVWQKLLAVS